MLGDNGNQNIIIGDLCTVIKLLFKMYWRQLRDTHPPDPQGNKFKGIFVFEGANESTVYLCMCKTGHSAFCTNLCNCI